MYQLIVCPNILLLILTLSTLIGGLVEMENTHEFRIVITPFCNYHCFFCHNEGFVEEYTPLLLSPEDYGFVTRIGKKYWGWDTVTITGGEPLISPIFRDVCQEIKKDKLRITVVTNASLVSNPKKILGMCDQVNISLHSVVPETYKKITGTSYPVGQVIDTITTIRSQLPGTVIHINCTIIKGFNDDIAEMEKILWLADRVGAEAKFIDLASENKSLVITAAEIQSKLEKAGFEKYDETIWQIFLKRGNTKTSITRCGFASEYLHNETRNLFLNPDGVLSTGIPGELTISVLREIQTRRINNFVEKVEWFFPLAKRKNG